MWTYEIVTGSIFDEAMSCRGTGYAGRLQWRNDPDATNLKGLGPLPEGCYTADAPADDAVVGKFAMRLVPDPENEMYGRNSFFLHGDDREHPGLASHGCIVQVRPVREAFDAECADRRIHVVKRLPDGGGENGRCTAAALGWVLWFLFVLWLLCGAAAINKAFASSGKRSDNAFGAVIVTENPYAYMAGMVTDGWLLKDGRGRYATNIEFWPLYAPSLVDERILFCGDRLADFANRRGGVLVTYRKRAARTFEGIPCHELVAVDGGDR